MIIFSTIPRCGFDVFTSGLINVWRMIRTQSLLIQTKHMYSNRSQWIWRVHNLLDIKNGVLLGRIAEPRVFLYGAWTFVFKCSLHFQHIYNIHQTHSSRSPRSVSFLWANIKRHKRFTIQVSNAPEWFRSWLFGYRWNRFNNPNCTPRAMPQRICFMFLFDRTSMLRHGNEHNPHAHR